jgi:hypothetical protein
MSAEVPEHNWMIDPDQPHAELLDLETGRVWQSQQPISKDAYEKLALPDTLRRVGLGRGVMDAHYFRRSPGAAADGPVTERDVDGHLFVHCANPPASGPEFPVGEDPRLLRVDKHHSLVFEAGREVDVIRLPDGRDFVQVVGASPRGGGLMQPEQIREPVAFALPEGWELRTEKLSARTTVHLPHPTHAWFFKNGTSFQGPVDTFSR